MIVAKMGVAGVRIEIHKDPVFGWHPTVFTTPARAVGTQTLAEHHASDLRAIYDLAEEVLTRSGPRVHIAREPG
jgi:hypothetical protein